MNKNIMMKYLLVSAISFAATFSANAWDIGESFTTAEGVTYKWLDMHTVEMADWKNPPDKVVIPATVTYKGKDYKITTLGTGCISNKGNVTEITVPSTINELGIRPFAGCSSLKTIIVEPSEKDYELVVNVSSFSITPFNIGMECTARAELRLHRNVHLKDESDILYHETNAGLRAIVFGDEVWRISKGTFVGFKDLEEIVIPPSVTEIQDDAFSDCTGSISLRVEDCKDESQRDYVYVAQSAFGSKDDGNGKDSRTQIRELYLGRNMPGYDFKDHPTLYSLTTGSGLTTLPVGMFKGCGALRYVELKGKFESIADEVFSGCKSLMRFAVPSSVTQIGKKAFMESGLRSITIPTNVNIINEAAFSGCPDLETVILEDSPENLYIYGAYDIKAFGKSAIKTLHIGRPVTGFDYHFSYLDGVTDITFGTDVKIIPSGMFCGSGMRKVTIPSTIREIGAGAFDQCVKLASVEFKEGELEMIGAAAFYQCGTLVRNQLKLTIPEGVREIGECVFTDVYYTNSVPEADSRGFSEIILPSTLEKISGGAFGSDVEMVTCNAVVPPVVENPVKRTITVEIKHGKVDYSTMVDGIAPGSDRAVLCVPRGSKSAYEATEPWSRFTIREIGGSSGVDENDAADSVRIASAPGMIVVSGLADDVIVEVYTMAGQQVYKGLRCTVDVMSGLYVVKAGDKREKVAVR